MRRTQIAAVVFGFLLMLVGIVALVSWWASGSNRSGSPDTPQEPPHCGGEPVALDSALSNAFYDLSLPDGTAAARASLDATWDCPGTNTLFEFSTGLTLNLDVNAIVDPPWAWENLADSNPKVFSVGDINGVPASFIEPSSDPDGFSEGGVTFVVDGIYVSVGGNGEIPLSELVDAAKALGVAGK